MTNPRSAIKYLIAKTAYSAGPKASTRNVCVLGLHRVLERVQVPASSSAAAMIMTAEVLRALLVHVTQNFVVLRASKCSLPDPGAKKWQIVFTLDDGWADNFSVARPIFKEFGVPFSIFLVTDFIGSDRTFWVEGVRRAWRREHERIALKAATGMADRKCNGAQIIEFLKHMSAAERAERLMPILNAEDLRAGTCDRMLTWDEVRELRDDGVEFGSHTASHPLLSYEEETTIVAELTRAKERMKQELGQVPAMFAYPNGDYDAKVLARVRAAGHNIAFTTQPGWHTRDDDALEIRRFLIHDGAITDSRGKFSPALFNYFLSR